MTDNVETKEPILNAPPAIRWLVGIIIAVHLIILLVPDEYVGMIYLKLAYIPARFAIPNALMQDPLATIMSPVGYTFLHGGWLHLFVNSAMLLAFGTALARITGDGYFFLIYCIGALAGIATVSALDPYSVAPVIGASASVSAALGGLCGLALRFRHKGFPIKDGPFLNPRTTLIFIGIWLALNVVFGLIPGVFLGVEGRIAWEAHLGGFVAGGLVTFFFPPHAAGDD